MVLDLSAQRTVEVPACAVDGRGWARSRALDCSHGLGTCPDAADAGARAGAQRWEVAAEGDANMRTLQKGDVLQLERKGYFIVDEPLARVGRPAVLFAIPDGKARPILEPPYPGCFPGYAGAGAAAAGGSAGPSNPSPRNPSEPRAATAPGVAAGAKAVAAAAQAAGAAAAGAAVSAAGGALRLLQPEGNVGRTPTPTPQPSGDLRSQL